MGWGKFLGDMAKGFAEGYIEERGIKGTMEDIGDLAKGIFSNDDSSEVDEFIDTYNNYIEQDKADKAISYVRDYYKKGDVEEDYIYHYLIGNAYYHKGCSTSDINSANQAKNHLSQAKKTCPIGEDLYDELKELLSEVDSLIQNIERVQIALDDWYKTRDQVASFIDQKEFDKASEILLRHYKKYEEGSLDSYYWVEMAKIYYAIHYSAEQQQAVDKYYAEFLNALSKAENLTSAAEEIEEIQAMKKWQKKSLRRFEVADVSESTNDSSNQNEQEFITELKACLEEDGFIADKERRLLDKLRKTLGISEERAVELEKQVLSGGLTSEEQEYLNEIKACFEDGDISDKERRLLSRLGKSLGISDERAAELESLVKNGH